jgi:pimeloyl-ACP methyl ester carboxylesterase
LKNYKVVEGDGVFYLLVRRWLMAEESVLDQVQSEKRKRRLRWFIIRLVILLIVLYAAALVIGIVFQNKFIYFPELISQSRKIPLRMDDVEIYIDVPEVGKIHSVYRRAPEGALTVLFLHGNGGNVMNYSSVYDGLVNLGVGVLMIDYPGYGKSEGSPSEQALYASAHAAVQFLESTGVKKEDIVVYGASLGSAVAAELAAGGKFAGLILQSPFPDIVTVGQSHYFFLPVSLIAREKYDTISRMENIDCPLLVIVGAKDRMVKPLMSRRVFEKAKEPKELYEVKRAGHNDIDSRGGTEFWEKLRDWTDGLKEK